ncbi:MAG: M16 family metallopeptidase [Thermonemataceae bacterium]
MEAYHTHTFDNGIRVIHKEVQHTSIAHCGFILDIGSRNEKPHQQGLAHFWEHMVFKGTQRRKAFHILNRLEAVGGELNAYTTKEKICFYASLLDHHYEKAVELLTDITFNSVFPEKQIEIEKGVILEEMAMYQDAPEDAIQDEFDSLVFKNHALGYNILGTSSSVAGFRKADFEQFIRENLNTERIIFSSVGNLPFKKVLRLAEKYMQAIPHFKAQPTRPTFTAYQPTEIQRTLPISQAHCAIGRTAYHLRHDKRLAFLMLNNILGGPSMNSRLNLRLREKYGLVYSVEANYQAYLDTGIWAIFFGTEQRRLNQSIQLVVKELKKIKSQQLGTLQLHYAKEQMRGQLAMAEENNLSVMLMIGKSWLDLGRIEPLATIFSQIDQVTAGQLLEVANEIFEEKMLSLLTYLPEKS